MKKRLYSLILFAAFLLSIAGAALASGGSQSDPLISKSYLEGTYLNALNEKMVTWIREKMKPDLDAAKARLEQLAAGYLSDLGGGTLPDGWTSSKEFVVGGGERKDELFLASGASFIWKQGSGIADQILVDVTEGKEVEAGGGLTVGHRYLSVKQTVVSVSSRTAYWAVQGVWRTTSDGVNVVDLSFTDVPENSWYSDAVYYAVVNGLFNGTSDTTFSPMMTMQRGMLTTVLHRLAGSPPVEYTPLFSDVPDGTWYSAGTVWAGQNRVVNGAGDGRFLPQDNVARQQIAVILYNYAAFIHCDTTLRGDLTVFSDAGSIASWAKEAVSWAVAIGVLRGSDGKVMPANSASRAEVAVMLQRFQDWAEAQ